MRGLAAPLVKLVVFALVTVVATGALAITIANAGRGGGNQYRAIFSDVTSLNKGDDVRIAGVQVGTVDKIEIVDRDKAAVTFSLRDREWLPASTIAQIRFRTLVGQRYIALDQGEGRQGEKLNAGGTIPLEQTRNAVNLTDLFSGFKPLFDTLDPQEVNRLSEQIIQVFQGEKGTVTQLVASTASLTNTVADRDRVIGSLIDNLNVVLANINDHGDELDSMLVNTQALVSGLAADRDTVGSAVSSLSELTDTTADVLATTRPAITESVRSLNEVATTLNDNDEALAAVLQNLPVKLDKLTRVASSGSWFQFYLCGIDIVAGPGANVPQLNLPTGLPTVNQPIYTNTAQRCNQEGMSALQAQTAAANGGGGGR